MSKTSNYQQMKKGVDFEKQKQKYVQYYINQYYDLYTGLYDIQGLEYQQLTYLLAQLWKKGVVWVRADNVTGDPVLCPFAGAMFNNYNYPTQVQLINTRNAPQSMIPTTKLQIVDKDGTFIYIRPNHKGFEDDVMSMIDRLAECQAAIDSNLYLQKFPWLLLTEPENEAQLREVIRKVLNGDPVVWMKGDPKSISNIRLDTPYVVDKLRAYQTELENKLKTLIGVDNQGGFLNSQQQNLDTTNCNNQEINTIRESYLKVLQDSFDRANEICGLKLSVKTTVEDVEQEGVSKEEKSSAKFNEEQE